MDKINKFVTSLFGYMGSGRYHTTPIVGPAENQYFTVLERIDAKVYKYISEAFDFKFRLLYPNFVLFF